jgi:hypothetical protein
MRRYQKLENARASSRKLEQRKDREMGQPEGIHIPKVFDRHSENKANHKIEIFRKGKEPERRNRRDK